MYDVLNENLMYENGLEEKYNHFYFMKVKLKINSNNNNITNCKE